MMLADELSRRKVATEVRLQAAGDGGLLPLASLREWRRLLKERRDSTIVLQYSPFCFAKWGFAPWLPGLLLAARVRGGPALAVIVHEPYVPMESWRWALMGLWQRFQLWAVRLAAGVVFTSIERWAEQFAGELPRRPVHHLPVGSNLPDARASRQEMRAAIGVDRQTLVVAAIGRDHPSWLADRAIGAVNALAASGKRVVFLALGAEAPPLSGVDRRVEIVRTGYLEAGELAAKLAACDLFLAPLLDGVSTRRGSLMAALQHGVPVVGTEGPLTDAILRSVEPALRLAPVDDREGFARRALELGEDPASRQKAAGAARRLYASNFDWPVVAERLLAALPGR